MDARHEFEKMIHDLQASAREFAALGLSAGTKALEYTGAQLKQIEELLKKTAEKLAKKADEVSAEAKPEEKKPEPVVEATEPVSEVKE